MKFTKIPARSLLFAAASTIPFAAQAQPVSPEGAEEIDDDIIIVTATRREGTVQDVPINISAVGGAQIEAQGLDNLREVAATVPGVYILDQGNRAGTPIVFRGLNATGLGSFDGNNDGGGAVSTYVGDIPLYVDLRLNDMERVEFLLGPQGTLYGAGTLGGAIRYIPVKPKFDGISGQVRADLYTYKSGHGLSSDTGLTINIPLTNTIAFRGSIDYTNDRGFIDYPYAVTSNPNIQTVGLVNPDDIGNPANFTPLRDLNTDDTLSARAALRFNPSDAFDATLTYYFQDARTDGRQFSQFRLSNFPVQIGKYENALRVPEPNRRKTQLVALEAELDLGFASLVSATGYSDHRELGNRDQTDLLITLEYSYEQFPNFTAFTEERDKTTIFTQEVRLVSDIDGPLSFIIGGFYNKEKVRALSTEFAPGFDQFAVDEFGGVQLRPDAIEYIAPFNSDLREAAVFGELSFQITDAWQVTAGGRYYDYDLQTESAVDLPLLNTVFFGDPQDQIILNFTPANQKDNGFLFKFNTSYEFTTDALLYATVSQGFRIGNSNGLDPCDPNSGQVQNICGLPNELEYSADKTTNYEIGFKTQWMDRRLTLNGAVYYIDWKGPQVASATINGSSPITINGAGAESKGFELYGALQATERLSFRGAYSYTDAQLTALSPSLLNLLTPPGFGTSPVAGQDGDRLPGSPKHQGSFFADYEMPVSNDWDLTLSYGMTAHSDVLTRTGSRAGGLVLPGFDTHNFSLNLSDGSLSITAYVNNIFNEFGETGVRGTPLFDQSVSDINGDPVYTRTYGTFVAPPRQIGIRVRKDF
uniref:TonB-dependent receptor n=1 Tax=Parerythrobacter lutipelagi TaxID=1964208 RepID=UPI0010F9B55B|nr:TonB-dependent receptor [Parerythrobacter lutipelagi]